MKSKKAQLIIDITKEVVEQYRTSLASSIEVSKNDPDVLSDSYEYECRVTRAAKCLEYVDGILNNFEKSMFDGEINENGSYIATYNMEKRSLNKLLWYEETTQTQMEEQLMMEGSRNMFHQLGIPEFSMYPLAYHAKLNMKDDNKGFIQIEQKRGRYNEDGKYKVGNLNINNCLSQVIVNYDDAITLRHSQQKPVLYDQTTDFHVNAEPILEIVDRYVKSYLSEKFPTEEFDNNMSQEILNEQNQFLNDTFSTLARIGRGAAADSRIEYSMYYRDKFRFESNQMWKHPRSESKNYDPRNDVVAEKTKDELDKLLEDELGYVPDEITQNMGAINLFGALRQKDDLDSILEQELGYVPDKVAQNMGMINLLSDVKQQKIEGEDKFAGEVSIPVKKENGPLIDTPKQEPTLEEKVAHLEKQVSTLSSELRSQHEIIKQQNEMLKELLSFVREYQTPREVLKSSEINEDVIHINK